MTAATSMMSGRNSLTGASRSLGELLAFTVDVENGSLCQSSGRAFSISDCLLGGGEDKCNLMLSEQIFESLNSASATIFVSPSVLFPRCKQRPAKQRFRMRPKPNYIHPNIKPIHTSVG